MKVKFCCKILVLSYSLTTFSVSSAKFPVGAKIVSVSATTFSVKDNFFSLSQLDNIFSRYFMQVFSQSYTILVDRTIFSVSTAKLSVGRTQLLVGWTMFSVGTTKYSVGAIVF